MEQRNPNHGPDPELCFWALLTLGAGLLLLALVFRAFLSTELPYAVLDVPFLAVGLILLLLAVVPARKTHSRTLLGVCVSILTFLLVVGALELTFRLIGYDFRRQESAWGSLPPYYRQPMTPTGTVFFRRRGPEEWTGQVIRAYLDHAGYPSEAYQDDPVLTVRYDANGFRNEEPMENWEIAVAGDSFTELGYVPYEELFTTIVARRLGCRVLNLGVAQTAALAQLSYLRNYGRCPTLKQTVIVFFEGNDITDLAWEYDALLEFEATGQRPFRVFEKQTSMLSTFGEWLCRSSPREPSRPPPLLWRSRQGDIVVTAPQAAPGRHELGSKILNGLDRFYREYREFGEVNQVRTLLAYMPCKARVLHNRLRPATTGKHSPKLWSPSDLPDLIAEGCRNHGIEFIDLTPALVRESERNGELLFNPVFDIHLNARGSKIVGRELARALQSAPAQTSR